MAPSVAPYLTFIKFEAVYFQVSFVAASGLGHEGVQGFYLVGFFFNFGNLNEFLKAAIVLVRTTTQDRVPCYHILFTTKSKVCELRTPAPVPRPQNPSQELCSIFVEKFRIAFIQSKKIWVEYLGLNLDNYPASEEESLASHWGKWSLIETTT